VGYGKNPTFASIRNFQATMGKTVNIDISQLEKEIEAKTAELEGLKSFLAGVKTYGQPPVNGTVHRVNGKKKATKKAKGKRVVVTAPTGISEWIVSFLSKGEAGTKDIVTAWAARVNKTYKQVYNSVSNALQRLKGLKTIDNRMNEGGRRFGATWYLK
jgi:hypothetical protein